MRFKRLSPRWHKVPRTFRDPVCFVFSSHEEIMNTYSVSSYEPKVDFSRNVVLSVHRGLCRTGGYLVRILGLSRRGNEVTVRVMLYDPAPDEFVTLVQTHPFDMVQVPKSQMVFGRGRQPLVFRFMDDRGREMCRREVTID